VADFAASKAPNLMAGVDARRSTRILQAVPLTISGQDRVGHSFLEWTSAGAVNCHGCRFPSRHDYRPGSWVTLEVPNQDINGKPRPVRAQVRFIRLPRSPHELYQVGVELETPANVWGVPSPPEDWLRFPGSLSAAAGAARAVAPAPVPRVTVPTEQRIQVPPSSAKIEPSAPAASATAEPRPPASNTPPSPGKQVRVAVSPDQLLRALEAKLQQGAEKAVASAVTSHLNTALEQAVKTIENASQASVRQIEERWIQHRERLVTSAREELLGRLEAELAHAGQNLRKQLELSLAQAQDTAQRLEKSVTQIQPVVAEAQGFLQEAARELQSQFSTRLRETADRAAADFGDETVRLSDRQLGRLTEKAQAATGEAATRLEARAAEARSQFESAAGTALAEFRQRAGTEINVVFTEARQSVESSLASFATETRADWEAHQRAWQDNLARLSEQEIEQFRQRLEGILNAWMVAAMSAVNDHSKALLDSLSKGVGDRLREAGSGPASR